MVKNVFDMPFGCFDKRIFGKRFGNSGKAGLNHGRCVDSFLKETVRLGRIPFDYTEEDLEEARRWERIVNDDVQDTGGEETCMVN